VHCVAATPGADLHPALDGSRVDTQVRKGQGTPAYSAFEAVTGTGTSLHQVLVTHGITDVDICGIATDHCVLASATDARTYGYTTTVLLDLCTGVNPETIHTALSAMTAAGVILDHSSRWERTQMV